MSGSGPAERIRRFAIADAAATFAGTALAAAVYVFAVDSPYMLWLAALLAAAGALMLSTLGPLRRGDEPGALMRLSIANWSISVAVSATTTFAWPVMVMAALLPAVLAPTFVDRSRLSRFVLPSLVLCGVNAVLGLMQDFSGISDRSPEWLNNLVLVVAAPVMGALVALIGLQHNLQMGSALDEAVQAQSELAEQAAEVRRSRARLVATADRERRRIERDLHDGAQQRLVGLRLQLRRTAQLVDAHLAPGTGASGDPAIPGAGTTAPGSAGSGPGATAATTTHDAREQIDASFAALFDELRRAADELRALGQGLFPPVLAEHGLSHALSAIAERSRLPVIHRLPDIGRLEPDVEAAVYFCCVESIHNANKHAGATEVRIELERSDEAVEFVVSDDGTGFEPERAAGGTGLTNMGDRLGAVGGALLVETEPGGGAVVRGRIPLST